jgi:serine/threonine protein phosphatase PrpC
MEVAQIRGPRDTQEDTCAFFEFEQYVVLGVFDGHMGGYASYYCSKHLEPLFCEMIAKSSNIVVILEEIVAKLDQDFVNENVPKCENDYQLSHVSGCTLDIAVIDKRSKLLFTAHLGDSRIMVLNKTGFQLTTTDHDWSNPSERDRLLTIENKEAQIIGNNIWKSMGKGKAVCMEVSRSVGDPFFKPWISAKPDIRVVHLGDDDIGVMLYTDGVHKGLSENEISELVRGGIGKVINEDNARKSGDNCTALVYWL